MWSPRFWVLLPRQPNRTPESTERDGGIVHLARADRKVVSGDLYPGDEERAGT